MVKIHTRIKRKLFRSTHHGHKPKNRESGKIKRTFKTEAAAKEYAASKGIKTFKIEPAKKDKKFKIVH